TGVQTWALQIAEGEKTAENYTKKAKEKVKNLKPGAYQDETAEFGALISKEAKQSVLRAIESAEKEGANIVVDGRNPSVNNANGFYLRVTQFNHVTPEMAMYKEEVFGPARAIVTAESLDQAINLINDHAYGNGVTIFTNSGRHARKFTQEIEVGMVGVNVPVPIPVGYHNFGGWKGSRFGVGQMLDRKITHLTTIHVR